MCRNIKLLYIILSCNYAWFWLGIWIPYYLKFTNYAGISVIEITIIVTSFFLEIPTGALADIIGKKKTLFIAFFLASLGNIIMGVSGEFWHLIISVLIMAAGSALLSGTSDALLYDSLKEVNEEDQFEKKLSNIQKFSLISMAVASIIGGFLYQLSPSLPFIATGIAIFIGMFLIFFIKEPSIDTEKFSFKGYIKQTTMGIKVLLGSFKTFVGLFDILLIASFTTILIEVLDPALGLNFGFNEVGLGILYAIIPVISAIGAHYYPALKERLGENSLKIFIILSMLLLTLASPISGLIFGGFTILFRNIFYPCIDILCSDKVNKIVESKYRATTISTFALLKKFPYLISGVFIGILIDKTSAVNVAFYIAIVFLVVYLCFLGLRRLKVS